MKLTKEQYEALKILGELNTNEMEINSLYRIVNFPIYEGKIICFRKTGYGVEMLHCEVDD